MSETPAMHGRVCLVTGATRGIGRVTAIELARRGADVLIVGRDAARCEAVAAEARATGGGGTVAVYVADLSSMQEVRRLAAEVKATQPKLHVLINNAGAIFERRETTVDGHEATFGLNHLAYFLLTHELRDLLVASAPARIVNVASRAHRDGWLHFDDLMMTKSYSPWRAYASSKLANVVFTRELARRLEGTGVTANSLHPGFVATNFGHHRTKIITWLLRLARPMMIGEAEGAATTLFLACDPAVEGVTGKYWADAREDRPIAAALDDGEAKKLWEASERLLGLA